MMKPAQPQGMGVEVAVTGGGVREGVGLAVAVEAGVSLTAAGEVAAAVGDRAAEAVSATEVAARPLRVKGELQAKAAIVNAPRLATRG